ncbi:hypothetical protein [Ornithinimicrobium cryptoxanthini]|uniref:hypothetical protein n=1 Tax=Ornithinimicrobium cryptoxanthini TaxID=2934161 RepID=UPI002118AC93|nr:hypothetical protein [Ornithinimicrobium cryptoxanthini]
MNAQWPGEDRETGRDPVEEFFAAHRAQIQDQDPDELTWQRIRDGRRRARSHRGAWAGGLVAAAAALAVVFGPSLVPDADLPNVAGPATSATDPSPTDPSATDPSVTDPSPTDPSVTDPSATDPGETESGDPTDTAAETVSTPVPEGKIPDGAWFTDTTTADPTSDTDSGVRLGLVARDCPANGFCAMLVRSTDGGITWAPQADLEQLGLVDRVLFSDQQRGWAWGAKAPLWATTDGGATWSTVATGASRVLDVSVRDDVLLATTASDQLCSTSPCPLPELSVVLTDPLDTDWSDAVAHRGGPDVAAEVLDAGTTRYVTITNATGQVTSLRLQDGRLEATAALSECTAGPVTVTVSMATPEHLVALCDDERGLAVQESVNGGRSWTPGNVTVPSFVLGEQPPLMASLDSEHLLLVGEGNYALTTDGGQTWTAEEFLPGASARPERIAVTQFQEIIVYPTQEQGDPDLGYWRSGDRGATWDVVTPQQ